MTVDEILDAVLPDGLDITFSGGDPLYQAEELTELARRLKEAGRNVWCYTGFTYEQLLESAQLSSPLAYIDVLVDGPFVEALRDTELRFRGSSNQRLIDLRRSTAGSIVSWEDTF